jgi:hypothetical protein
VIQDAYAYDWDVRNSCKHNGAVLPLPSAPEGRGADGVDAMASLGNMMMMMMLVIINMFVVS